jgi:RalA-binding protein 1
VSLHVALLCKANESLRYSHAESGDTQSDEGEDFSLHDESGTEAADMTENESIVESSATHGSTPNGHLHPSDDASTRSRISSVAASRGLNIAVTDKATRRQSRMVGLPHSPRPHHASPHSPHTPQKFNSSPSPSLNPPASPLHTPR